MPEDLSFQLLVWLDHQLMKMSPGKQWAVFKDSADVQESSCSVAAAASLFSQNPSSVNIYLNIQNVMQLQMKLILLIFIPCSSGLLQWSCTFIWGILTYWSVIVLTCYWRREHMTHTNKMNDILVVFFRLLIKQKGIFLLFFLQMKDILNFDM